MLDLGSIPTGSEFPSTAARATAARTWPLRAWICPACLLLQLDDAGPDETDGPPSAPAYRSPSLERHLDSLAAAVLTRAKRARGGAGADTLRILEVASHGGHVQEAFEARGARTLIAERSAGRARAAARDGRTVMRASVGQGDPALLMRAAGGAFDVLVDEFLLAHLRDPGTFLTGVRQLLAPGGFAVLELAHVRPTIAETQYDSIRHGHFAYYSLLALESALRRAGLEAFDVEELPLYGGSLRAWVQHAGGGAFPIAPSVASWRADEARAGLDRVGTFTACGGAVARARTALRDHLEQARAERRTVVGYGAPSRATTLLSASGITSDLLPFTVDRSPAKHGRFVAGSAIPILAPDELDQGAP